MKMQAVSPSILLIEDNSDHAIITEKILRRANPDCTIHVANSYQKATEFLHTLPPESLHVILLDMDLPDATGLDVLRAIREIPSFMQVPVWLLSSWCDDEQLESAFEFGIRGYLEKPLDRHGMEPVYHLLEPVTAEVGE